MSSFQVIAESPTQGVEGTPSALVTSPCANRPLPRISDLNTYDIPNINVPNRGESFYDPVFGVCMIRLTDHAGDQTPTPLRYGMRASTAAMQPFNADGSLAVLRDTADFWYLYSLETLQVTGQLPFQNAHEIYWDPINPDRLYFFSGAALFSYDLEAEQTTQLHDFSLDFPNKRVTWAGTNDGNGVSENGQFWGIFVRNENKKALAILVYDASADRLLTHLDLPDGTRIQSTRLSPSGEFLLVLYEPGCTSDLPALGELLCGLVAYDRVLEKARPLLTSTADFDTALGADQRDLVVFHDQSTNAISMLDLKNGEKQALWLIDPLHTSIKINLSGRATQKSGWLLVSTYTKATAHAYNWMDNSIFAIELKANGRVVRLAHTHSTIPDNDVALELVQPQASPNPAFTQILFTSNWGQSEDGQMDAYLIALPDHWIDDLPE